jgi:E3 ubiquitin-protein ligase DOA10
VVTSGQAPDLRCGQPVLNFNQFFGSKASSDIFRFRTRKTKVLELCPSVLRHLCIIELVVQLPALILRRSGIPPLLDEVRFR